MIHSTESMIARRLSERKGGGKSTMLRIASVAVAVSFAVMIVAMSVIDGFRDAITDKLTGFTAHVKVEGLQSASLTDPRPIIRSEEFENKVRLLDNFNSVTAFAAKDGIIKSPTAMQGTRLKGVESGYDSLFYKKYLVAGHLPSIGDTVRRKEILISRSLAGLLQTGVGEKIEMIFTGGNTPVRRDVYKISGLYDTGMADMDKLIAITDIRNVQRMEGWTAQEISGYEIMADNFAHAEQLSEDVRVEALFAGGKELWRTSDIKSDHPYVFDWLATHDINALVIIVIMLTVALLNMISALLIIIFERTQMIGVLKALGMRNRSIQNIFLLRSLSVILRGVVWGNIIGLGLAAVQALTGAVKLDAEAYLLSAVPVSFGWDWWLSLNIGTPIVLLALLAIPVAVVARIKPEQTLKYQ